MLFQGKGILVLANIDYCSKVVVVFSLLDAIARLESAVGKKMAAVHFTTMPCEPNTAYKAHKESQIFAIFVPVQRTLSSLGLKILQRFCTFLRTFIRLSCAKNSG